MVRLGPSASNNQPWRAVKDHKGLHFYLKRNAGYNKIFGGMDLQKVDMGIAMCHFELAAEESGLDGGWSEVADYPGSLPERTSYIISWIK
jgi:nitroreductase